MKYKELTRKAVILLCVNSFVALALGWVLLGVLKQRNAVNTIELKDHWTVDLNGEIFEEVSLDKFSFNTPKKGDYIEMNCVITEEALREGYSAKLLVYLCSVEAFLDDKEIYCYGTEKVKKDVFLGSGYHFIELPVDCVGKTLTLRFVFNENNAISSVPVIECDRTSEALRIFASNNVLSLWVNIFIMMFGVVLTLLGIMVKKYNKTYKKLICLGLFGVLMGNWGNCANKLYQLFSSNLNLLSEMEYFSLYYAPVPIAGYIYLQRKEDGGWRRTALHIAAMVAGIYAALSTILHFTNVVRAPGMLVPFHIISVISLSVVFLVGVFPTNRGKVSDDMIMGAVSVLGGSVGMELIRFNLQKFVFPNNRLMEENSFLPIGTLLFVILLIASYLMSLYEMLLSNAEKEALTKIAYHDPLTGLYNRAKSQEVFAELEGQDNAIGIVNFDVNGLKFVNDTFGHDEGDKMLKAVAKAIEESFGSIGTYYRLSGDEYMAIVSAGGIYHIGQALHRFEAICKEASRGKMYIISVSYGYALRNSGENISVHDLYNEADENMYEMKMKSEFSRRAQEERASKEAALKDTTKND